MLTVITVTNGHRLFIQEGDSKAVLHISKENSFGMQQAPFFQDYQSNLTTQYLESLLNDGSCDLPDFATVSRAHEIFI